MNGIKRLGLLAWLAGSMLLSAGCGPATQAKLSPQWAEWQGFSQVYMSDDGRIVDRGSDDSRTVSEGQAYGLFFALVGQDRPAFDKLLSWTANNLANGDLSRTLPAWHWGVKDGVWGVIDANSASDADLWIAYTLLEAGRLWCAPEYEQMGRALAANIVSKETAQIPGLGLSVLPGMVGFAKDDGSFKLNPSYLPPFQMQRLAALLPYEPRWAEIYLASQQFLLKGQASGRYPDWVLWKDHDTIDLSESGNYDAIRTYFWLALTADTDPVKPALMAVVEPMMLDIKKRGQAPADWSALNLEAENQSGAGPAGFQYMMEPLLRQFSGNKSAVLTLPALPASDDSDGWKNLGYFNSVLALFSQGFLSDRYSIGPGGELILHAPAEKACGQ